MPTIAKSAIPDQHKNEFPPPDLEEPGLSEHSEGSVCGDLGDPDEPQEHKDVFSSPEVLLDTIEVRSQ